MTNNDQKLATIESITQTDCRHPYNAIQWEDTFNGNETLRIPGTCTNCGLQVEEVYRFEGVRTQETGEFIHTP